MESLANILGTHRFFAGLDKKHIQTLAGCAANVRFKPGEYVFHQGEPASFFYLIRHGKIAMETYAPDRGRIVVQTHDEGQAVGWSWLVPPYRWQFDARAVEMTRAIALNGECLRGKFDLDHDLGYEILKKLVAVLADRLDGARLQVVGIHGV